MLIEEYTIENTKIKFYDDCIVEDTITQKEYIDNTIINLIKDRWINFNIVHNCNLSNFLILIFTN